MATTLLTLKSLLLLTFTTTILSLPSTTNTKPQKIITNLIYRGSILSPWYNPDESMLKNSNARFRYLQAKSNSNRRNLVIDDTIAATHEANLVADNYGFAVNFSIGQPPIPQLAIMDTGSTFLWIQCKPCIKCFEQKGAIYDPSVSFTYINLSCNNRACFSIRGIYPRCDYQNNCNYQITYQDHSYSRGQIGMESLTFETPDDGIISISNVIFGCGKENTMTVPGSGNGIFGLGDSRYSIVSKLGLKFSYCIGNIHDPLYQYNRLTIGNYAEFEGDSTPLEIINGIYYLTLESITIGQERLDIDYYNVFSKSEDGEGGVVIDTGSELTYFPQVAYDEIRRKVFSILDGFLSPFVSENGGKGLCYQGNLSRDVEGFPVTTLHFANGAELALDIESLFYRKSENLFCLALVPFQSETESSVIGVLAQQNYNVGYDLGAQKIYFQRIDCQVFL